MTPRTLPFLLIAAAAFGGVARGQDLPATSPDGLERRTIAGLDIAYVRPGADVSEYDEVLLGPVSVSFRRNFERDAAPGPNKRVSESDLQGIRERLGTLLQQEVVRELEAGGYRISREPGHDVMRIDLGVLDLTMALAPQRQGPDEVLAFSTGEMLLQAEIYDSTSGEKLAQVYDLAEGRVTHQMHRISRSENEREAREIATAWAKTLREKLDAARAKGPAD